MKKITVLQKHQIYAKVETSSGYQIVSYDKDGRVPVEDWFNSLRDRTTQNIIVARIVRLKSGGLGNSKMLRDGLRELKISYGPGYRIYFAEVGKKIILLLCGGDKSSQDKDIDKAIEFLKEWRGRNEK